MKRRRAGLLALIFTTQLFCGACSIAYRIDNERYNAAQTGMSKEYIHTNIAEPEEFLDSNTEMLSYCRPKHMYAFDVVQTIFLNTFFGFYELVQLPFILSNTYPCDNVSEVVVYKDNVTVGVLKGGDGRDHYEKIIMAVYMDMVSETAFITLADDILIYADSVECGASGNWNAKAFMRINNTKKYTHKIVQLYFDSDSGYIHSDNEYVTRYGSLSSKIDKIAVETDNDTTKLLTDAFARLCDHSGD